MGRWLVLPDGPMNNEVFELSSLFLEAFLMNFSIVFISNLFAPT
jgi:hypothetical protein